MTHQIHLVLYGLQHIKEIS